MKIIQGIIFDNNADKVIIKEFASSKRGFTSKHKNLDKNRYSFIFKWVDIDFQDAISDISNKNAKEAIETAINAYYKV